MPGFMKMWLCQKHGFKFDKVKDNEVGEAWFATLDGEIFASGRYLGEVVAEVFEWLKS